MRNVYVLMGRARGTHRVLRVDVATLPCDAESAEALALLQLDARRRGLVVRAINMTRELRELLEFLGLSSAMATSRGAVEGRRAGRGRRSAGRR